MGSVIPVKAGIQLTLLWIPACAGKTIAGREFRTISALYSYLQDSMLRIPNPQHLLYFHLGGEPRQTHHGTRGDPGKK